MNQKRFFSTAAILMASASLTACTSWQMPLSSSTAIETLHNTAVIETPCPPAGKIVERDLTVPWTHRRYLLSNGQVCCPVMADNTAACAVTTHPLPNTP